jgi:hypothetical protein
VKVVKVQGVFFVRVCVVREKSSKADSESNNNKKKEGGLNPPNESVIRWLQ